MKVSYHNSIHDYPGLGMFSGWSTHGGLACIDCMADVDSTWLPNGASIVGLIAIEDFYQLTMNLGTRRMHLERV